MSEIETSDDPLPNDETPVPIDPTLTALYLAEEQACGGYVEARKAQIELAKQMASLHRLIVEQPRRADYRENFIAAGRRYRAARDRTNLAYAKWQEAQMCTDGRWTDTTGRTRGQAVSGRPVFLNTDAVA